MRTSRLDPACAAPLIDEGRRVNVLDICASEIVLKTCKDANQLSPALRILQPLGDEASVTCHNLVLGICGAHGDWRRALQLLKRIERPDEFSFGAAIKACQKDARWEEALQLLGSMSASGVEPNTITFNSAISACGKGT